MSVLGFRSDSSTPRYAIVEKDGDKFLFINAASESRLCFPAGAAEDVDKLTWLYREFERIFSSNPNISRVVIKKNEFTQGDTAAKRQACYQDAALIMFCGIKGVPVCSKLYTSLDVKTSTVLTKAEERVGVTSKYWNNKMADAVVAAWWGAREG